MSISYQEELKALESYVPQEGGIFWKPEAGKYSVKALSELDEAEPYEDKPQAKIKLLINGEEKTWTFVKGKTKASTYGQLVDLASKSNNTLLNKEFTVVVISDGNKNSYTIV